MDKQMAVHHRENPRRRSHRRLRTLFLSGGLMAAMVAAPALAGDSDPAATSQKEKKKPAPKKEACIKGPRSTRFISQDLPLLPDQSYARVTWEARFCRQGDEWTTTSKPSITPLGAGSFVDINVQLEDAPHLIPNGVRYRAFVRRCQKVPKVPVNADVCPTLGTATFSARVVGKGRVRYGYEMDSAGPLKKIGKLKWTDKIL